MYPMPSQFTVNPSGQSLLKLDIYNDHTMA